MSQGQVLTAPEGDAVRARVADVRTRATVLRLIRSAPFEREELIREYSRHAGTEGLNPVAEMLETMINSRHQNALARGVRLSMLLELSEQDGGGISFDVIGKMKAALPAAYIYSWTGKDERFAGGKVHAKIAVAEIVHAPFDPRLIK